jgi:hypothetical protein
MTPSGGPCARSQVAIDVETEVVGLARCGAVRPIPSLWQAAYVPSSPTLADLDAQGRPPL